MTCSSTRYFPGRGNHALPRGPAQGRHATPLGTGGKTSLRSLLVVKNIMLVACSFSPSQDGRLAISSASLSFLPPPLPRVGTSQPDQVLVTRIKSSTRISSSFHNSFRTIVPITPRPDACRIHPADQVFFIGSCFSDTMGNTLEEKLKMKVEVNPFGTSYNPVSIARCLHRLATGRLFDQEELLRHPQDGRWIR
jgi:hypothetical protein